MRDERQAAIDRIRKLLQMTKANGCTEAEAMAAAEKAARLMAELGLQLGDLAFGAERAKAHGAGRSIRVALWNVIAAVTNTDMLLVAGHIEYVGRELWPEVARYLHQVTDRAIERELRTFRAGAWYRKRKSVRAKRAATFDFTSAMVVRLRRKLLELFAGTMSETSRADAAGELARRYPALVTLSQRAARPRLGHYYDAAAAGARAGDGVEISHGVAANGVSLQIGGAS